MTRLIDCGCRRASEKFKIPKIYILLYLAAEINFYRYSISVITFVKMKSSINIYDLSIKIHTKDLEL